MDGHDGIDFGAASFDGLSSPDVADSGKIVGLRGVEQEAVAPTRWAGGGGKAFGIGDGAVIEIGRYVGAALTRNGFHPDSLIRRNFRDIPMDGDAFHDGGRGQKDRIKNLGWVQHTLFDVGIAVAP